MKTRCYELLIKLVPNINEKTEYIKLKSDSFMDLNIDFLARKSDTSVIALSHYYKHQSGDLIADPDMTMVIDFNNQTIEPLSYQDCFGYQDVNATGVKNSELEQQLLEFLTLWLTNLNNQSYQ